MEQASSETHVTWLNQRKVKSFYRGVVAAELRSGVNMLLQVRATLDQSQHPDQMQKLLEVEVPIWVLIFFFYTETSQVSQCHFFLSHTPPGGRIGSDETKRSSDGVQDRLAH